MDLPTIVGIFNIFAGLMLVAAILLMGGGIVLWIVRLGTYPTYRDEAIDMMKWAVVILFVLIVLLIVVRFVQEYPKVTAFAIGVVFFTIAAWLIASTLATAEAPKDEH